MTCKSNKGIQWDDWDVIRMWLGSMRGIIWFNPYSKQWRLRLHRQKQGIAFLSLHRPIFFTSCDPHIKSKYHQQKWEFHPWDDLCSGGGCFIYGMYMVLSLRHRHKRNARKKFTHPLTWSSHDLQVVKERQQNDVQGLQNFENCVFCLLHVVHLDHLVVPWT